MTTAKKTNVTCYGQTNAGRWCQEVYDSMSKDAGRRARQLRKVGYAVVTSSMGSQVTPVGTCKLTMVDIRPGQHADTCDLPRDGWTLERL